ncbi:MAG: efflux RND transporter periplasmic adaptor subunit [Chromatiales bacterium]
MADPSPLIRPGRRGLAMGLALALAAVPARAQEPPPVGIAPAERTEIVEELSLTGTLTSPLAARLATEVEGRVARIAVDAGAEVSAEDTLIELDDELARLDLDQARAARREAEVELADARRRLSEVEDLARRNSVADTQVRALEAEVRRDAAVLDRRRAETAHRAAVLERHRLEAPFGGVVARRMTDLGEWVGPDTPVMELVAVDRLRLDLQVPQSYFGRVKRGTPVGVRLDALPELRLQSAIGEVVPVSDPSARTFLARVALDNGERRMTPGMSARATLRLGTGRDGLAVPRDALIRYPDGRISVWVAEGTGETRRVSERQVEIGKTFAGRVEIASGLEAGVPVVVRGNETLQEGQEVRVRDDG